MRLWEHEAEHGHGACESMHADPAWLPRKLYAWQRAVGRRPEGHRMGGEGRGTGPEEEQTCDTCASATSGPSRGGCAVRVARRYRRVVLYLGDRHGDESFELVSRSRRAPAPRGQRKGGKMKMKKKTRISVQIGGPVGTKMAFPPMRASLFAGSPSRCRCGARTAPAPRWGHGPGPSPCPRQGADAIGQAQRV